MSWTFMQARLWLQPSNSSPSYYLAWKLRRIVIKKGKKTGDDEVECDPNCYKELKAKQRGS